MKIKLRYPMAVRSAPGNLVRPRWSAWTKVAEVDVPEYGVDDAPVVIDWRPARSDQPFEYRDLGGELYRASAPVRRLNAISKSLVIGDGSPTRPLALRVRKRLDDAVAAGEQLGDGREPDGWFISEGNWPEFPAQPPRRCVEEDVLDGEREFQEYASELFVSDGRVWARTPEPVVVVYRNNEGWQSALTSKMEKPNYDGMRFHFPLDRFDEASAFAAALAERTGVSFEPGSLALDPRYAVSRVTDLFDMSVVVDRVVDRLEEATNGSARKPHPHYQGRTVADKTFADIPIGILRCYVGLRAFAEIPFAERTEADVDAIAGHLEDFLPLIEEKASRWIMPSPTVFIRAHLDKWNGRRIALDDGNAYGVMEP